MLTSLNDPYTRFLTPDQVCYQDCVSELHNLPTNYLSLLD
jgi:hypothetical protein